MEQSENIEPNTYFLRSPSSSITSLEKINSSPSYNRTPTSTGTKKRVLSNASPLNIEGSCFDSPLLEEIYDTPHENSGSKKKAASQRNFAATWSPTLNKVPQTMQLKMELDRLKLELVERDNIISAQTEIIQGLTAEKITFVDREEMYTEDIKVKEFYMAIQDQKIDQLDNEVSTLRMKYHDATGKLKKYKLSLKQLSKEKEEFESKSNLMVSQLNEQMIQLQTLAVERIQTLEESIMKSRHENDQLRSQVTHLEKQLKSKEEQPVFFERRAGRSRRPQYESEDNDFITEDNYLDLNASTMSHCTVSTENRDDAINPEGMISDEESEENVDDT